MDKAEIRKEVLKQRKSLTAEYIDNASKDIFKRVCEIIRPNENLFLYIAMEHEVQTGLFMEKYKNIAVPKCKGRGYMDAVTDFKVLEQTAFGTVEPKDGVILQSIDAAVVPGLAFSKDMDRIGYGAGYYDRFFVRFPDIYKIGVCFDFQLRNDFSPNANDIKMDCIITEKRVIMGRQRK